MEGVECGGMIVRIRYDSVIYSWLIDLYGSAVVCSALMYIMREYNIINQK